MPILNVRFIYNGINDLNYVISPFEAKFRLRLYFKVRTYLKLNVHFEAYSGITLIYGI